MEKSIEKIWKEGFLKSDALIAPKLNDLYNQKSKHIVDQLKKMFRVNLWAIIGMASVLLILSVIEGVAYIGLFLFLLFLFLVIYGKKQSDKADEIDNSTSSYDYLKAFDTWLKGTISGYARIYRIFYPVFFLTFMLGLGLSATGQLVISKLIAKYPDIYLVQGLPVFWIIGSVVFAILLTLFAGALYRLDIKSVYGHVFKKLDEIIADMEELRR